MFAVTVTNDELTEPKVVLPVTNVLYFNTAEEPSPFENNKAMAIAGGAIVFTYFFGQAEEQALKTIRLMVPFVQHAYQYDAHGFYNNYSESVDGNRRRKIL